MKLERMPSGALRFNEASAPVSPIQKVSTQSAITAYRHELADYASVAVSDLDQYFNESTEILGMIMPSKAGLTIRKDGRVCLPHYNQATAQVDWVNLLVPEGSVGVFCQTGRKERSYVFLHQEDEKGSYIVVPTLLPYRYSLPSSEVKGKLTSKVRALLDNEMELDDCAVSAALDSAMFSVSRDVVWCKGLYTTTYRKGRKSMYSVTGQSLQQSGESMEDKMVSSMLNVQTPRCPSHCAIEAVLFNVRSIQAGRDKEVEDIVSSRVIATLDERQRGSRTTKRVVRRRKTN